MKTNPLAICLISLLLLLSITACANRNTPESDTTPTPPSLPTHQTPFELLTAAVEKAKSTVPCTIQYGTINKSGDDIAQKLYSQAVSADQPWDADKLYRDVPDFPTNEALLSDFCSLPLRAIPSNNGTIRYELADLTWSQFWSLAYGSSTPEDHFSEFRQALCSVTIETDANGRFSRLELTTELYRSEDAPERTVTVFLAIQYPES